MTTGISSPLVNSVWGLRSESGVECSGNPWWEKSDLGRFEEDELIFL